MDSPLADLGAVAAGILRRWVEAEPAALAAVPIVVLGTMLGDTTSRCLAASKALGILTGAGPSSEPEVAASVGALRDALEERGLGPEDLVAGASSPDPDARRRLTTALGIVLAGQARNLADLPHLAILAVDPDNVTQLVGELVAMAASIGIQVLMAPREPGIDLP